MGAPYVRTYGNGGARERGLHVFKALRGEKGLAKNVDDGAMSDSFVSLDDTEAGACRSDEGSGRDASGCGSPP